MIIAQSVRELSLCAQTDKQTNKQMKGQSEIAYLPKWNANDDANDENDDACEDDLTHLK